MAKDGHPFVAASRKDGMVPERAIQVAYNSLLANTDPFCVLDGGAHKGYHTFRFLSLDKCARVYAVEANQGLAEDLIQKVAKTEQTKRVSIVASAIQEDSGLKSVTFMQSGNFPGRSGIHSIFENNPEVQFDAVVVPATTIDDVLADRDTRLAFVKLDLEGGEYNAIRGGLQTLNSDRPVIVTENSVHSPRINGFTPATYIEMFDSIGYAPVTFLGEHMTAENMFDFWYLWLAPKEDSERLRKILVEISIHPE